MSDILTRLVLSEAKVADFELGVFLRAEEKRLHLLYNYKADLHGTGNRSNFCYFKVLSKHLFLRYRGLSRPASASSM